MRDRTMAELAPGRLQAQLWALALITGAVHGWVARDAMNADGIAYIEIGNAYIHGDWRQAINGYWSPLYSWLLAAAISIFRPSAYWEFTVVHFVNFVIFVISLGCFRFLLSEVIRFYRCTQSPLGRYSSFPDWAWLTIGYGLFLWTHVELITLSLVTPDGCVAAFVYLAAGLLIRIKREGHSSDTKLFVFLGLVLAFAYLAKAIMFPLAFVFLAAGISSIGNFRKGCVKITIALATFSLVAAPFIVALSTVKDRITFGDAGKLNYAWYVMGTKYRHWQTDISREGTPKHTTRRIFTEPAVYEFGTPMTVSYPPWYDPSYWFEGVEIRFDLRKQRQALVRILRHYFDSFFYAQSALIFGSAILCWMGWGGWKQTFKLTLQTELIYVALVAFGIYALVHVESRHIAPFIVLFWLGILSSLRLQKSYEAGKLVAGVSSIMSAFLLIKILAGTAGLTYFAIRDLMRPQMSFPEMWRVADGLRRMGIKPGDRAAIIGWGSSNDGAYWAHLANIRIVAEIPQGYGYGEGDTFWRADATTRLRVYQALAETGVKILVAPVPPAVSATGWQKIGDTKYYVNFLPVENDGMDL